MRTRLTTKLTARARALIFAAAAIPIILASAQPARAQVEYSLLPAASWVRWDEQLAFGNTAMFGARLAAEFGPLLALEAQYITRSGVDAFLSQTELTDADGAPLADQSLEVTRYGLNVRLNLASGRAVPFLKAGGSVLRLDNAAGEAPRQIALSYGGGIQFEITRNLRAQLFGEDVRFRLDRSALAPNTAPGSDPEREELHSNLAIGAALGIAVGPRTLSSERPDVRWSVASVPIEPFAGRLDFADAALPTQSLAGIRAGLDVGNYAGLRAYYWQGVNSGFSRSEPLHGLGGEVQFNFNAAPRIAPYIVLGGGTLRFHDDYLDAEGQARSQMTLLTLGAGVGLRLTDKFRLNIAARDMIGSPDQRLDQVARAGDLAHNWMYSAGLTFSIGRSRRGIAIVPERETWTSDWGRGRTETEEARGAVADTTQPARAAGRDARTDVPPGGAAARRDGALPAPAAGYHSGQSVTIPVPTEGELTIRYGPSGAGRQIAAAPDPQLTRTPGAGTPLTAERLAVLIDSLLAERRNADSLLIRDLVSREVSRRTGGDTAQSHETELLRRERDEALAEVRRLAQRIDSLEGRRTAEAAAAAQPEPAAVAPAREAAQPAPGETLQDLMLRELARLPSRVAHMRGTDRGLAIVLGGGAFSSGQGSLTPELHDALATIAAALAFVPEQLVLVEGHTDEVGSEDVNARLSLERANSVRNALLALGVAPTRVTAYGRGEMRPIASNDTADGRARNRRVEIILPGVHAAGATLPQ